MLLLHHERHSARIYKTEYSAHDADGHDGIAETRK